MCVPSDWFYEYEFDGGDSSCSELILPLKQFFHTIPTGIPVLIIARDTGAMIDIPAWCWSTGHALTKKNHPYYLITKKLKQEE